MHKLLVPVDGSEHALEAVRHAIDLVHEERASEVHLLYVQPPLTSDVTTFVPHSAVLDFYLDEAGRATEGAQELLDRAGIPYTKHIAVGHPASTIAEYARELRCDRVIMGIHGFGVIANLLLGSVSRETLHLMDPRIPVTLIKASQPVRRPSPWRPAHARAL